MKSTVDDSCSVCGVPSAASACDHPKICDKAKETSSSLSCNKKNPSDSPPCWRTFSPSHIVHDPAVIHLTTVNWDFKHLDQEAGDESGVWSYFRSISYILVLEIYLISCCSAHLHVGVTGCQRWIRVTLKLCSDFIGERRSNFLVSIVQLLVDEHPW